MIKHLLVVLVVALSSTNSFNSFSQTDNAIGKKLEKFHIETRLGVYTSSQSLTPTEVSLSAIYQILPRLSVQVVSNGQYFIPKHGLTDDYNYAFGLGGGIGFTPLPIDPKDFDTYEIRANITAPIVHSCYKNMGYDIGIFGQAIPTDSGIGLSL